MRSAYDETLATARKRKHEPQRLVGDLLKAEISEKQARSIRYQLTVANPLILSSMPASPERIKTGVTTFAERRERTTSYPIYRGDLGRAI
jgi:hypothetical protein